MLKLYVDRNALIFTRIYMIVGTRALTGDLCSGITYGISK